MTFLAGTPRYGVDFVSVARPIPAAADALLRHACFATGYDMAPVPSRTTVDNTLLHLSRDLDESGHLLLPWPVGSFGTLINTTSTLRESDTPYRLLVELARGKLNQVRQQMAEWEEIGLRLPDGYQEALVQTTRGLRADC